MRFGESGIKRALADVERALNAGHPAPIKLLERKIDCLLKLGLFSKVCNKLTYNLTQILFISDFTLTQSYLHSSKNGSLIASAID